MNNNFYICIKDFQFGDFAVGTIANAKEWGEIAYNWALSDNWSNPEECLLENFKNEKELISFICDIWEIEIVKIEKNNKNVVNFLKNDMNFNIYQINEAKKMRQILGV